MIKNFRIIQFSILLTGICLTSCENETTSQDEIVTTNQVSQKLLSKLADHDINTSDVNLVDFVLPNGKTTPMYKMEGDIHMSEDQIKGLNSLQGLSAKNYHTTNLVNQNTTIDIIGFTGPDFALSANEQSALELAVNNYNNLGLSISFNLTFGTDFESEDMVVYNNDINEDGAGGSAGFPENGAPFKFVQIFGLTSSNVNVIEHVITHEIGHSVGFRHTDWFSRESCGQNTNEGTAGVGAIPIPGTPEGFDPTSVMLACFSSDEDGEFNENDITALNFLY